MTIVCPLKKCNKCNKEKSINDFHIDKTKNDGHKTICKNCRSTSSKNHLSESRKNLDRCINTSIYKSIKKNRRGYIWENLFGYTLVDLKEHLEKQFEKEMSWDNFGSCWWIDKIIPRSAFRYSNVINDEFKKCWSLKNLRPLGRISCIKKRNKIKWGLIREYNLADILPVGLILFDKK